MNSVFTGEKIVWGSTVEIKPITNTPEGRQRLRLRHKRVAKLYVKTATGIKGFYVLDKGDHWEVSDSLSFGSNTTIVKS